MTWPDWRTEGGGESLHYQGTVHVRIVLTQDDDNVDQWRVQFRGGVHTFRRSIEFAKACAENSVACDADLPEGDAALSLLPTQGESAPKFEAGQRVAYEGDRGAVHRVDSVGGAWLYVIKFDNGLGIFLDDPDKLERID